MYQILNNKQVINLKTGWIININNETQLAKDYAKWITKGNNPVLQKPSKYHILDDKYNWIIDESKRDELIRLNRNKINTETDAKILTGFKHNSVKFKLSIENQINFSADVQRRDSLNYPRKIKALNGYYEIKNAESYLTFYNAGVAFIETTLNDCWIAKDALKNLSTEELINKLN